MAHLWDTFQTHDSWQSMGRFLTVGMLGTIIDVGLFTVLRVGLGVPALAANTLSYSAGIINNYVLHQRWTYAHRPHRAIGVQFCQFLAVSLSALLLNNLIVLWLARPFSAHLAVPGYGDLLAKACATAVGLGWNYLANNFWTFRNC